jgi:hypothetical protein
MAMAKNNQRGSNNNNKEGRNQYSGGAVRDYARERPATTAVAAAAAVGAGVFLWSRRSQISEQLSGLSDQIGQWSEKMNSGQREQNDQFETAGSTRATGMSETGGGNASLGAHTGGTGSTGSL